MPGANKMTKTNQISLAVADYESIAAKYRPIFEKIAATTLDREQHRRLPFEEIQWLKQAGFGALRRFFTTSALSVAH